MVFRGGRGNGAVNSGFRVGSKYLGIFLVVSFDAGFQMRSSDLAGDGLLTGSNARIDLVFCTEPAGFQVGSGRGGRGCDGGAFDPMNFGR